VNNQFAQLLAGWQEAQRVFWSAAAGKPAFETADAFAPPDWQAFDGFVASLIEQVMPASGANDLRQAHAAVTAYRDVIMGAWTRIRESFDEQRRALHDPARPPDWRLVRDRWLATAETEFIRTQRSPGFLSAQRDVLSAAVALMEKVPPDQRRALADARLAAGSAAATLRDLGIDGVRIATTPKTEIWRDGKATLSRYHPLDGRRPTLGPILLCHGLIGRQTMTDLLPERSAVRQLLAAGADVFVIDWGSADRGDADLGLDEIVAGRLPAAIEAACAAAGADSLVLFGICQGGTLAACHAALDASRLKGLVLAVSPFDFHADVHDADPAHGLVNLWLRSFDAGDLVRLIELEGNLSGELLGTVFNQLNPVRTLAKYSVELLDTAADAGAFRVFMAMEKWLADRPDLPGRLARQWLIDLYRNNDLALGRLEIAGRSVRLGTIALPVLNVFATGDHIVPPPCTRALGPMLPDPARYRELALPTGHVGAFVSERAQTLLVPEIARWLKAVA
jgi:polyhydroxyalkanoate synthase